MINVGQPTGKLQSSDKKYTNRGLQFLDLIQSHASEIMRITARAGQRVFFADKMLLCKDGWGR